MTRALGLASWSPSSATKAARPVKSATVAGSCAGRTAAVAAERRRGVGRVGESVVGLQDALLELGEFGARVDAEFVGEQPAGVGVDGQRLGLPSAAVEGEHQQFAQPLAQRVGGGQRGQFGDGLGVAADLQV